MMNRVGNGHAWAALLLLAAACDGGGGGGENEDAGRPDGAILADAEIDGDVDGETPDDDGGTDDDGSVEEDSGADPDAGGEDDGAVPMDADMADSGGDTDAGSDAETDSGPSIPDNCAESAITAGTGGSVTSTDSRFTLTVAGGQLSADSTVRVCVVAAASAPQAAIDDGRVGDVYEITTTNSATFTGATATFSNHSSFPGPDSAAAFTPVHVRTIASGGAAASGGSPVLSFHKAASNSSATLTATVSGPGLIYAAPLEAAYQVEIASPKLTYVTGEVIDISPIVSVAASPTPSVTTRTLEAEVQGCDLEIMNVSTDFHEVRQTESTRSGCSHYVTVERSDRTAPPAFPNVEGSTALTNGNTVNLRADNNSPPRLFCKRPGAGWGATRLYFRNGTATDLTIEKRLDVTCTYSGDWVAVYDQVEVTRSGSDLSFGAPYTPAGEAWIAPPGITYTAVAPDAVRYSLPAASNLSSEGPANFSAAASYLTAPTGGTVVNTSTVSFTAITGPERYSVVVAPAGAPFYEFRSDAQFTFTINGSILDCFPVSASVLALDLSAAAGASTSVSTLDGTIDLISIRATFGGTPNTVVQRWVDATRLTSHEAVPLLTAAQQTELASLGAATEYLVGFYRVVWDESRRLWPGGRVIPVACGTVLRFLAADVAP